MGMSQSYPVNSGIASSAGAVNLTSRRSTTPEGPPASPYETQPDPPLGFSTLAGNAVSVDDKDPAGR